MTVTPEVMRLGPPFEGQAERLVVERRRDDRLGEDDVDGIHGRIPEGRIARSDAHDDRHVGARWPRRWTGSPEPTSPKKSLMPAGVDGQRVVAVAAGEGREAADREGRRRILRDRHGRS